MPLCTPGRNDRQDASSSSGASHPLHNISTSLHNLLGADNATYLTDHGDESLGGATYNTTGGQSLVLSKEGPEDLSSSSSSSSKEGLPLNELQLIKAVVLMVVVAVLLLSTCRVVFKTFSRYGEGVRRDEPDAV